MISFLGKIVRGLPLSIKYRLINSYLGNLLYRYYFDDCEERTIRVGEVSFQILAPKRDFFIWKDYEDNGCHEPVVNILLKDLLQLLNEQSSPVFWDIGSKVGYYMILAGQYIDPSNIHVFEPNSVHYKIIQKNNRKFLCNQAKIHDFGLSDERSNQYRYADGFANNEATPDIVKIDVDGGEENILSGMENTIKNNDISFLIEIHVQSNYKSRRNKIDELLGRNHELWINFEHRDPGSCWEKIETLPENRVLKEVNDYFIFARSLEHNFLESVLDE